MILDSNFLEVDTQGFSSTKSAGIACTPTMLRMLSSGIYSDKITAFIRELGTNAYDAMLQAGTLKRDNSFFVHLPTKLEPWYTIRDYGTGLSQEQMEENFADFGKGTKGNSNDFNGAFGLGSKSPLAYVDMFSITSYYNGKATFYTYGKDQQGIPTLCTAYSIETDEHNGLEIQIAIAEKDIQEVLTKAERVFRFFDIRPETNIDLEYKDTNKILEGRGWYLRDTRYESAVLVMSNVAYKLNNFDDALNLLRSTPLVIYAENGAVDIPPSREILELTEKTKAYVAKRFKEVNDEAAIEFSKKVDKFKGTDMERLVFAKQLLRENTLPFPTSLNVTVGGNILNASKNSYTSIYVPSSITDVLDLVCHQNGSQPYTCQKVDILASPVHFVILDGSGIQQYKEKFHDRFYLLKKKAKVPAAAFKIAVNKLIALCGEPKCVKLSDVVQYVKKPVTPKVKKVGHIFPTLDHLSTSTYTRPNKETPEYSNVLYLVTNRGYLPITVSADSTFSLLRTLERQHLLPSSVYLIPLSEVSKTKEPEYINLVDYTARLKLSIATLDGLSQDDKKFVEDLMCNFDSIKNFLLNVFKSEVYNDKKLPKDLLDVFSIIDELSITSNTGKTSNPHGYNFETFNLVPRSLTDAELKLLKDTYESIKMLCKISSNMYNSAPQELVCYLIDTVRNGAYSKYVNDFELKISGDEK